MTALTRYRVIIFAAQLLALPFAMARSFRRGFNRVKECHGRR